MKQKISLMLLVTLVVTVCIVPAVAAKEEVLPYSYVSIDASGLLKATKSYKNDAGDVLIIPAAYDVDGQTVQVKGIADKGFASFGASIKGPIILEEGIETIGKQAFQGCNLATSFTIPSTVTSIGLQAFQATSSVEAFNLADTAYFKAVGNELYTADGKELIAYGGGDPDTLFVVPEGVETIRAGAMRAAENLEYLVLPSTLASIGTPSAIFGCPKITTVVFTSTAAPTIGGTNFNNGLSKEQIAYKVYYPENGTGYSETKFTKFFEYGSTYSTYPTGQVPMPGGEEKDPIQSVTRTAEGYDVTFAVPDVEAENPYIAIALYDQYENLVGVASVPDKTTTSVSIASMTTAAKARLMIWDSALSMVPCTDAFVYEIQ